MFIDKKHNLVGVQSAEDGIDAANVLKPDLVREMVQVIGATIILVYHKYIKKDVYNGGDLPNKCNGWTSNAVI